MGKYPTTNITLKGLEDKGLTLQLIDEKNQKWTLWKADFTNKDQDSEAYRTFKSYHIGESFGVSYGEKEESFVGKEGNTVNFTRRTIYQIMPLVDNPSVPGTGGSPKGKSFNKGANIASDKTSDENFWDKKAYKQCLWGFWLANGGTEMKPLDQQQADFVWQAFKFIEADADTRFSDSRLAPSGMTESVTQGEDLNVEDIPF